MDTSLQTMLDLAWWTPWRMVVAVFFVGLAIMFLRYCFTEEW